MGSVQVIFYKDAKTIQWGKGQCFQQLVWGKLDIYMHKYEIGPISNTI